MIIPSHAILANAVSDYMEEKYGFHFVANAIYRGSVMPDLRDKENGSHYSEACLTSAAAILEEIQSLNTTDIKSFSYKVGQLTHFISDYFTNAHNKGYLQRNMRLHMLYEMRLHFQLIKAIPSAQIRKGSEIDPIFQIKVWHNTYSEGRATLEKDVHYILQATFYLIDMVVADFCKRKASLLLAA